MYVLSIVVCPFVLFLLAIVLSVLRFMDSDYPFGIFKVILIIAMLEYIYICFLFDSFCEKNEIFITMVTSILTVITEVK